MKILYLFIVTFCFLLSTKMSMSNPEQICLAAEPEDTGSFGSYVAINDKYLAVGDPHANRVSIYTRDDDNQWTRTKYILPPKNSVPYRIGFGFGYYLKIDKDVLFMSAQTHQDIAKVLILMNFSL